MKGGRVKRESNRLWSLQRMLFPSEMQSQPFSMIVSLGGLPFPGRLNCAP